MSHLLPKFNRLSHPEKMSKAMAMGNFKCRFFDDEIYCTIPVDMLYPASHSLRYWILFYIGKSLLYCILFGLIIMAILLAYALAGYVYQKIPTVATRIETLQDKIRRLEQQLRDRSTDENHQLRIETGDTLVYPKRKEIRKAPQDWEMVNKEGETTAIEPEATGILDQLIAEKTDEVRRRWKHLTGNN